MPSLALRARASWMRCPNCSRKFKILCFTVWSNRHQELQDVGFGASLWTSNPDTTYDVEADERYRRTDMATMHAYDARILFVNCIKNGAAQVDLALAALAIAAEDDALVTHSTVPFPIDAYRERIRKLAVDCQRRSLAPLGDGAHPDVVTSAVEAFLFEESGFKLPPYGRSGLPQNSVVVHAGVWEDARQAYLHELLVRKQGSAAALAVLLHDVMRHLFLARALDFAVRVDCRAFDAVPRSAPLPLPRRMLELEGGGMLNTCTTDALREMLRHLKRAFWPFAWDTGVAGGDSQGGFRAAAREVIEGPVSAQIQIIARAAKNRLERGVWTSPGAGDIRRALAACERLVLLCHTEAPWERRDLGVLLMFRGLPERAKAELLQYSTTAHAQEAEPIDQRLLGGLLDVLREVQAAPQDEVMSLAFYEDPKPPDTDNRFLPLTW